MTEEIIIDGVNVAGCSEFLKPDGCDDTDCASFQCDRNTNCYYKQLKRLEQENKKLNFKINQLKANGLYNDLTGIELSTKVFELEQKNKQMKSALEEIKEIAYGGADVNDCTFCHNIYNKINEVLNNN